MMMFDRPMKTDMM